MKNLIVFLLAFIALAFNVSATPSEDYGEGFKEQIEFNQSPQITIEDFTLTACQGISINHVDNRVPGEEHPDINNDISLINSYNNNLFRYPLHDGEGLILANIKNKRFGKTLNLTPYNGKELVFYIQDLQLDIE